MYSIHRLKAPPMLFEVNYGRRDPDSLRRCETISCHRGKNAEPVRGGSLAKFATPSLSVFGIQMRRAQIGPASLPALPNRLSGVPGKLSRR